MSSQPILHYEVDDRRQAIGCAYVRIRSGDDDGKTIWRLYVQVNEV